MIKPGTLCMIRGVPSDRPGHEFNGFIVTAQGIKTPEDQIRWIEPALVSGLANFSVSSSLRLVQVDPSDHEVACLTSSLISSFISMVLGYRLLLCKYLHKRC